MRKIRKVVKKNKYEANVKREKSQAKKRFTYNDNIQKQLSREKIQKLSRQI